MAARENKMQKSDMAGGVKNLPAELQRVIQYIDRNLTQDVSLETLSAVAGFSKFHFIRRFKSIMGVTPHAYIMMCRLDSARNLLEAGESVVDVAFSAGFADQSHLIRRFKAVYGVTPGKLVG